MAKFTKNKSKTKTIYKVTFTSNKNSIMLVEHINVLGEDEFFYWTSYLKIPKHWLRTAELVPNLSLIQAPRYFLDKVEAYDYIHNVIKYSISELEKELIQVQNIKNS